MKRINFCFMSGEGVAPLFSLGHDLLRFLLMLDGIGLYEVGSVRLACKALLRSLARPHEKQGVTPSRQKNKKQKTKKQNLTNSTKSAKVN